MSSAGGGYPPYPGGTPQMGYQQPPQMGYQQPMQTVYQQSTPGYPLQQPPPMGFALQSAGGDTQTVKPTLTAQTLPQPGEAQQLPEEGSDPTPTAPPIDPGMAALPGYEGLSFDGGHAPPPPVPTVGPPPADYGATAVQHHVPTEQEVRQHLTQFVAEHCCYGRAPITDIKIISVTPTPALKYSLDSMTERRITKWDFRPWQGEPVPPITGPPPEPWQISMTIDPTQYFMNLNSMCEIPNTATVRVCHDCKGQRDVRCTRCYGRGFSRCVFCHGRGSRAQGRRCVSCHGHGSRRCSTCHGNGMINCPSCQATGNIRCYVLLTVVWENHSDVSVVERTDLPDDLIKTASGEVVFSAEDWRVYPLVGFPDQHISAASQKLLKEHDGKWTNDRIYRQRHSVQSVPVNTVRYEYGGKTDSFFIYGKSNKVFFPDYPRKCCCCAVM